MAQLAIKGHSTRGKEVIEILEMLGGKNVTNYDGRNPKSFYFINNIIICSSYGSGKLLGIDCYTLEQFLEKFPYKVGDKVYNIIHNENQTITNMFWDVHENEIIYQTINNEYVYVNYLQPYKEGIMDKTSKAVFDANAQCCDITNHLIKEETMEENVDKAKAPNLIGKDYYGKRFGYKIPNGYEFDCIKNNEIILKPKQPQYPKTFIEVLNFWHPDRQLEDDYQRCYKKDLIEKFQDLLYARDAYWKIAGEQMGLGKPWEPDWVNAIYTCTIICRSKKIIKDAGFDSDNRILAFPTEEMRDAFYENFNDLIEKCKELL